MEYSIIVPLKDEILNIEALFEEITQTMDSLNKTWELIAINDGSTDGTRDILREMEKEYIQGILTECSWNVTKASKILDINRVTLHKMIKRYDLKRES